MGQEYLIDSNILIDYAANRIPYKGSYFIEEIFENQFIISVIAKIEVLGFNDFPHKMEAMENFVGLAQLIPLNERIIKQTIDLRRKYKKLKLGDAIIAATALVYHLTLLTRNINDFKNIENLYLINPYEI